MVLLIFTIFILFLIGYNKTIIKNERLFIVEANKKSVNFSNGLVIINNKTHYFLSPKIKYDGENVILKNYTAGYYIGKRKIYEIKSNSSSDEFDLKGVIENENFSVYEPRKKALIFSKEVLKKDIKIKFKLIGKTKKDKDFSLEIPLNVEEI